MAILANRGALLLRFEAPALSSLPEERQEKREHTVASRCPFPLLGGTSIYTCAEEFQAKVTEDGPETQRVSTQGFSSAMIERQRTIGGMRAEVYLLQLWKKTKERVVI